ncbi:MAG: hypothetical protein ACLT1W_10045 [Alistipes onderdonkii]
MPNAKLSSLVGAGHALPAWCPVHVRRRRRFRRADERHSLVWPSLWPLAIENLGKCTSLASAILIMGIAGGAVMPMLSGLGRCHRQHLPYLILVPNICSCCSSRCGATRWAGR